VPDIAQTHPDVPAGRLRVPSIDNHAQTGSASAAERDLHAPSFDSSIPVMLLRAREAMMCNFRPLLAAHGYTEQQWRVLRTLESFGALDAAALSERSVILPPSLTRILRTLEDRGLLERRRDASDRRRTMCTLSEAGRAQVEALAPQTAAVHNAIEARFGVERTRKLQDLLREIAALD
jgi:homoprotocatechuate degradation regulator HpaR